MYHKPNKELKMTWICQLNLHNWKLLRKSGRKYQGKNRVCGIKKETTVHPLMAGR